MPDRARDHAASTRLRPCEGRSRSPQRWAGLQAPGRCRRGRAGAGWAGSLRAASGSCRSAQQRVAWHPCTVLLELGVPCIQAVR